MCTQRREQRSSNPREKKRRVEEGSLPGMR